MIQSTQKTVMKLSQGKNGDMTAKMFILGPTFTIIIMERINIELQYICSVMVCLMLLVMCIAVHT